MTLWSRIKEIGDNIVVVIGAVICIVSVIYFFWAMFHPEAHRQLKNWTIFYLAITVIAYNAASPMLLVGARNSRRQEVGAYAVYYANLLINLILTVILLIGHFPEPVPVTISFGNTMRAFDVSFGGWIAIDQFAQIFHINKIADVKGPTYSIFDFSFVFAMLIVTTQFAYVQGLWGLAKIALQPAFYISEWIARSIRRA